MQTWSGPNTGETTSSTRKLTTYALLFFSLAGLIAGFAFGGFWHANGNNTANNTGPAIKGTQSAQATSNVTPTPSTQPVVPLGFPQFTPGPTTLESATGGTEYSVTMQVIDKSSSGKPVHASDITCKVWLVQQIPTGQALSLDENTLKNVNNLTSPIMGTINNKPAPEVAGLTFDPSTPQTGFCDSNGQRTWKYTLASTVPHGNYDLVILADWRGMHWNWSWANITIQ
jgi:hypothetical protein